MKVKLIVVVLLITLLSCSSTQDKTNAPKKSPVNLQMSSDLNLILEKLKTEEADTFAPLTYKIAYEKHQNFMKDNRQDFNLVLDAYHITLKKIEEVKKEIPELLNSRVDAIKAGGNKDNTAFKKVEEDLLELVLDIEKSQKTDPSIVNQLIVQYRQIELDLIKEKYLKSAKVAMDECLLFGGTELAPKTMKEATIFYDEVNKLIDKDRYNDKLIGPKSVEATFMAQRALNIILDVKKMSNETREDSVLRYEKLFENIAKTLEISDIRNKSFFEQQEEINEYIISLFKAGRNIQVEKTQMSNQIQNLKEEVGELSKKERFRNIIGEIQKELTLDEAEVYEQEERLIIRLTGLKFTSGQVDLSENHQIFLSKVGEIIQRLGKSVVVVEGHTDDSGNEQINQELSTKRALAVREYFLNKNFLTDELSSSMGYGDTRPIANNKTAQGRMQNRRVDLIITPVIP